VLAQDVDQLQAYGVAERLRYIGHSQRVVPRNVWVDDGLAAALSRCSLLLRGQLQIDAHRYTYINNTDGRQSNTMREMGLTA
jgi:hypothetical protein